jgi:quinoprotein glucose dehydrogenase
MRNKKKLCILLIFFILSNCNNQIRNEFASKGEYLNIYKKYLLQIEKAQLLIYESIESFLLKYSKNHKDYWNAENDEERKKLPKYKFINAEINPTNSNNNFEYIINDWTRSHGNNLSNKFSELDLINKDNIKKIKIAWIFRSEFKDDIQCNPIIINGIIYTPISGGYIAAINGYNGELIWKSRKFDSSLAKRGLVFWKDENNGNEKIFFSNEKNLVSINAKNGLLDLSFGYKGIVRTGFNLLAPVIYDNQLIIVTFDGYVESYNIFNGDLNWKLKWKKNINKIIGGVKYDNNGGNPWGGTSLDKERGIFYFTTGNPSYLFDGTRRPGSNNNSNSVFAIDLKNKKKLWSFQEISHDLWNLDLASPPILTTIKKSGKLIDVVVVPSKIGNTLILDRFTGNPIFEFRLEKVETSTVPGEKTSAYQPNPIIPEPFEKGFFNINDIREKYQKEFSKDNYEFGFYKTPKLNKVYIRPNITGGAQWPGASVDHKNNVMYVTSNNIAWETQILVNETKGKAPKFISLHKRILEDGLFPINNPPWGTLNAINLNNGKLLWKVPLGNYDSFYKNNNLKYTGTENFGGVVGTRGGITIASGTLDKKIYFHDAINGELLHSISLPYIGSSPPSTYFLNNEQFIIIHSTGGRTLKDGYNNIVEFGDSLVALKLFD